MTKKEIRLKAIALYEADTSDKTHNIILIDVMNEYRHKIPWTEASRAIQKEFIAKVRFVAIACGLIRIKEKARQDFLNGL